MQYAKPSNSSFGFFWNAVAKLQNAHASLDEQVAYWFGLNQSKYQWALDDYYETKNIVSLKFLSYIYFSDFLFGVMFECIVTTSCHSYFLIK